MKLSIIIVHHGPTAALQRCLDSLTAPGGPQREVFVVHNGGDTPPKPQPPDAYTVIPNPGNPGFAHACNIGAAAASGTHLLFLNPDAIATPGDLQTLLAEAAAHPEYTVLSCRQTNSQGRQAKAFDTFPTPATLFGLTRALARLFSSRKNPDPRAAWEGVIECDWVSGSVLLIATADLEAVDGWSEDYWLYMEDVDLCRRIRDQGQRIGCTATLTLIHDHGTATRADEETEAACRAETTLSSHAWAARHLTGGQAALFHWLQLFRTLALLAPVALIDLLTLDLIAKLRIRRKILARLLGFYFSAPWKQKWTSPRAPSQSGAAVVAESTC